MTERQADRCVVIDPPTEPIRLALFAADGGSTVASVDPVRALLIAGDLLVAARRRLPAMDSAQRTPLPNRRFQATRQLKLDGTSFFLSIGLDADHRPREVFIKGGKEGTDLQLLVEHVAIVLSHALQRGATPAELTKTLARSNDPESKWPALLIPAVLGALVEEAAA